MGEVTINKVRSAINKKISTLFPDVDIFDEEIKQGLEEYDEDKKQGLENPAFFVALLDASHNHEIDRRYKRTHLFDIHYFPVMSPNLNYHLNEVVETLYVNMELVEFGKSYLRGSDMSHEYLGGILHFFVSYDFFVNKEKEHTPKMESLIQSIGIKEEEHD